MLLFLSLFILFANLITPSFTLDECKTPDNQLGECVIINHCPHIFNKTLDPNKTENHTNFIKLSHCGLLFGIIPKVCCPLELSTSPESGRNLLPDPKTPQNCGNFMYDDRKRDYGEAALTQYPWSALIEYETMDGQRSFYCGGSLINKRYVLTAAHCVKSQYVPRNAKIVSVRLGEYNTESDPDCEYNLYGKDNDCLDPPQNIPVAETIVHEEYDPINHHHDIALLRLKNKIKTNVNNIQPICLPFDEQRRIYVGTELELSGWAQIRDGAHHFIKRTGLATVRNRSDCNFHFKTIRMHQFGHLCASGKNLTYDNKKDFSPYPGDTGGMLLKPPSAGTKGYAAVGILSKAPSNCCQREHHPRIYTNIANYLAWIISKLKP